MPYKDTFFDAICVSPVYGNRVSDSHNAKDGSKRVTYTHMLGRKLTDGNTGCLQWGEKYKQAHQEEHYLSNTRFSIEVSPVKVIFNEPSTTFFFKGLNGETQKIVDKCHPDDIFSKDKGYTIALLKATQQLIERLIEGVDNGKIQVADYGFKGCDIFN